MSLERSYLLFYDAEMKFLALLVVMACLIFGQVYGASEEVVPKATSALEMLQGGEIDAAAQQVEKELEAAPVEKKGAVLELKGRIQLAHNEPEKAVETLNQALDMNPELPMAAFYIGEADFKLKRWPESVGAYRFVLSSKKMKDTRDVVLKVIYCEIAMGELSEAGKLLNHFDLFDGQHPGYYFAKAAISRAMGKSDEADTILNQVKTLYGLNVFNRYEADYFSIGLKSEEKVSPEIAKEKLNSPLPSEKK